MTCDPEGTMYHTTTIYSLIFHQAVKESQKYFLGILNNRIVWFFQQGTGTILRGGYFRFKTAYLEPLPIRTIDFSNPVDVERHDRMVTLVERILALHKQLADAKTPTAKELLQRQIDATDRQIDRLVYELTEATDRSR